jgi:hypothetical protein
MFSIFGSAVISAVGSAVGSAVSPVIKLGVDTILYARDRTTFDPFNTLNENIVFDPTYTLYIDKILGDKRDSPDKNEIHFSDIGKTILGKGTYYYRPDQQNKDNYVLLEKLIPDNGNVSRSYYKCHMRKKQNEKYGSLASQKLLLDQLKIIDNTTIRVLNITRNGMIPTLQIYKEPKQQDEFYSRDTSQTMIAQNIIQYYKKNQNNVTVLITGKSGVGKTYISKIVKKMMEKEFTQDCYLIPNFNPSVQYSNVFDHVLQYADTNSAVVCVMNEFDVIATDALTPSNGEEKSEHTKDKGTFNNMLDTLSDTNNFIGIYTSELTRKEIAKKTHESFVRNGRIKLNYHIDIISEKFYIIREKCD